MGNVPPPSDIDMRFVASYAQQNWLQNVWSRFFEFLPPKFFKTPKSKKQIENTFLNLEDSKELWGPKS